MSVEGGGRTEHIVAILDIEHNFFSGHGAERVWPGSLLLSRYLLARFGRSPETPGLKVVELGAGTSLPSLVLARLGCSCTVPTDVPWALPLTEYNVEAISV